jgi:hypothetical protein
MKQAGTSLQRKCLGAQLGVLVPIDDRDRVESLSPLPRGFAVAAP